MCDCLWVTQVSVCDFECGDWDAPVDENRVTEPRPSGRGCTVSFEDSSEVCAIALRESETEEVPYA
jgi:hypothetical protein